MLRLIGIFKKKKIFNVRNTILILINSALVFVPEVNLFVHVRFPKDNQRPYSNKNFGVLQYEGITSVFYCLNII